MVLSQTGPNPPTVHPITVGVPALASATAYGQLPAGQNVPVGIYSDRLTVTVNY